MQNLLCFRNSFVRRWERAPPLTPPALLTRASYDAAASCGLNSHVTPRCYPLHRACRDLARIWPRHLARITSARLFESHTQSSQFIGMYLPLLRRTFSDLIFIAGLAPSPRGYCLDSLMKSDSFCAMIDSRTKWERDTPLFSPLSPAQGTSLCAQQCPPHL